MDIPALGRDSVIFESFSFISLDSIMDSIDSSQIPLLDLLIGRGRRMRPEGAEELPPRWLLPGWGRGGARLTRHSNRSVPMAVVQENWDFEPNPISASSN